MRNLVGAHSAAGRSTLTHERAGRILAGLGVLFFTALGVVHSPVWLVAVALIGLNLTQSGITDRCGVKSALIQLGLPGERDLGRLEAWPRALSERAEHEHRSAQNTSARKAATL